MVSVQLCSCLAFFFAPTFAAHADRMFTVQGTMESGETISGSFAYSNVNPQTGGYDPVGTIYYLNALISGVATSPLPGTGGSYTPRFFERVNYGFVAIESIYTSSADNDPTGMDALLLKFDNLYSTFATSDVITFCSTYSLCYTPYNQSYRSDIYHTGAFSLIPGVYNPSFVRDFLASGTATLVQVTPEPSSFALLGTGLLGIAGVTRRRS